jgi:hypothetical protein
MSLMIAGVVGNAPGNAQVGLGPGILTQITVSTADDLQEPTMTNVQVIVHPSGAANTEAAFQLVDGWLDNYHPVIWNGFLEINDGAEIRLRRTGWSEVTISCQWQILTKVYNGAAMRYIRDAVRTPAAG